MACLNLNIHSGTYAWLKNICTNTNGVTTVQFSSCTIFVLHTALTMKMATSTWVTFSDSEDTLFHHLVSLLKLPILIYTCFILSFYIISVTTYVSTPKISHNLDCIISIKHQYLSEKIIVFFIFYSIQFITHLHLSFISVLSVTRFI